MSGQDFQQTENALPFWCLMFFTFVLFIAPQAIFPSLEPLRLAKASAGLAGITYILDRLATGRPLTVITPEVRLVVWLICLAVLSIPLSFWPGGSLDYLLADYVKSVIIFFLIVNLVQTERRMRVLIGSIIGWGVIISSNALLDFRMGNWMAQSQRIVGYSSPLASDPNDLALTLNLILALTIGFYLATTRLLTRLMLLAVMLLLAAGVIASFSRGGFLALSAILIISLFGLVRKRGPAILLPLIALLLLAFSLLPPGYGERIYSIYDSSADETGSADARWTGMVRAFKLMFAHPLLGSGLNMNGLGSSHIREGVHSAYLQVGADLGIPALLIYLTLNWYLCKGVRQAQAHLRGFPSDRGLLGLGTGIEIALITYVVGGFLLAVAFHFHFYYIAGFAIAFSGLAKRRRLPVADLGNTKSIEPPPHH